MTFLVIAARGSVVDVGALRDMLDERVKLVSLCHVPTSNGLRNDAAAVGALLRDHPALYLLDACQSVGQIALDVTAIGCDIVAARSFTIYLNKAGCWVRL